MSALSICHPRWGVQIPDDRRAAAPLDPRRARHPGPDRRLDAATLARGGADPLGARPGDPAAGARRDRSRAQPGGGRSGQAPVWARPHRIHPRPALAARLPHRLRARQPAAEEARGARRGGGRRPSREHRPGRCLFQPRRRRPSGCRAAGHQTHAAARLWRGLPDPRRRAAHHCRGDLRHAAPLARSAAAKLDRVPEMPGSVRGGR